MDQLSHQPPTGRPFYTPSHDILHPIDKQKLIRQGLLLPLNELAGTRSIHVARLNSTSDAEYRHLPALVPHSKIDDPPFRTDGFITIPDKYVSWATLVYIGFTVERALEIWNGWEVAKRPFEARGNSDPLFLQRQFLRYVWSCFVGGLNTRDVRDYAWVQVMNYHGIAYDMQQELLDPARMGLRGLETCVFWVWGTMGKRYAGLYKVQKVSSGRAEQLVKVEEERSKASETRTTEAAGDRSG